MDLDRPSHEAELLAIVRELVRELSPQRLKRGDVTLTSRLDRDLGIDSLARTELILRIERAFRVRLAVTAGVGKGSVGGPPPAGGGGPAGGANVRPSAVGDH